MRSPIPDSLHIFNAISGTPTATTIQGLPNSSSVVWTWPLHWPYDLSPFVSHLQPWHTQLLSQMSSRKWRRTEGRRSIRFCLIQGISPTVSCGDTVYFTFGHFAIFISNRCKESRGNDAEKRGRMIQKTNSCPQCEHRLQRLFTYYKYLRPLLIYFLFC